MDVMMKAKELGDAIAKSAVVSELKNAQAAYDTCAALQDKLTEYGANRAAMGEAFKKEIEKQDPEMLKMIKARIDVLGKEIVSFPEYTRLSEAQKALQALIADVNAEISYAVYGIRPNEGECTHDCSTCKGCH